MELKYLIREEQVPAIRDYLHAYLELDPFGAQQPDFAYPVHSIYLDSSELDLFQSTINGNRNRFKLRIRFYENTSHSRVFCEIKRRENNGIFKQRAALHPDGLAQLAAGQFPDEKYWDPFGADNGHSLWNFLRLTQELDARPTAHVCYGREAWGSACSNRYRVTIDRDVRIAPQSDFTPGPIPDNHKPVFADWLVLELKFTQSMAIWMHDLVRMFNLRLCSAAKYVDGVLRLQGNITHRMQTAYR